MNRRNFVQNAMAGALVSAQASAAPQAAPRKQVIGIQVGAVSFVDEGVDPVLDNVQKDASVNTLFVATFTYGRGIAGRQDLDSPCPTTESRSTTPTTVRAATTPKSTRSTTRTPSSQAAPKIGDYDVLETVLPEVNKRGMKSICWYEDVWNGTVPNVEKPQEKRSRRPDRDDPCSTIPTIAIG